MTRKIFAEGLGTAFLIMGILGSGIYGEAFSNGNTAIALLANAISVGCMLFALIICLGPISGAHFNPAVSLLFYLRGESDLKTLLSYVLVQIFGAIIGVWVTHAIYGLDVFQISEKARSGIPLWASEGIVTFGLLFVILGGIKYKSSVPALVGCYIAGAHWYTSSTGFANPAITIGRMMTNTFTGIDPADTIGFIMAQIAAVFIGHYILTWLYADT